LEPPENSEMARDSSGGTNNITGNLPRREN
jgi:hypothetical protein